MVVSISLAAAVTEPAVLTPDVITAEVRLNGNLPESSPEIPLTGSTLKKVVDTAKSAVPGATIFQAETAADGITYEVHLQDKTGASLTIIIDRNFDVISVNPGGFGQPPAGPGTSV